MKPSADKHPQIVRGWGGTITSLRASVALAEIYNGKPSAQMTRQSLRVRLSGVVHGHCQAFANSSTFPCTPKIDPRKLFSSGVGGVAS